MNQKMSRTISCIALVLVISILTAPSAFAADCWFGVWTSEGDHILIHCGTSAGNVAWKVCNPAPGESCSNTDVTDQMIGVVNFFCNFIGCDESGGLLTHNLVHENRSIYERFGVTYGTNELAKAITTPKTSHAVPALGPISIEGQRLNIGPGKCNN